MIAEIRDGYWTLPCADCGGRGWFTISTVRGLRLLRDRWWRWPVSAAIALKRRECTPCKGTGRVIVTLASPVSTYLYGERPVRLPRNCRCVVVPVFDA